MSRTSVLSNENQHQRLQAIEANPPHLGRSFIVLLHFVSGATERSLSLINGRFDDDVRLRPGYGFGKNTSSEKCRENHEELHVCWILGISGWPDKRCFSDWERPMVEHP